MLLREAQFAHGEFSSRTLADRAFRRVRSTPSKGKDRDRMGEAKRRRQQPAKRTETVIELDEQTNEERRVETIVRDGGSVSTFLKKGLNGVPCNGCRMCCYHPRIEVEPQDDVRHLDIETHEDGGQTLRRREDGSCVHLGPEGCTVYAHRPRGLRRLRIFGQRDKLKADRSKGA
jgi:Putative zinc- or iron-chelating domain